MSKRALIIRSLEDRGFWIELTDLSWFCPEPTRFIAANGGLKDHPVVFPSRIIEMGLFKDKASAVLTANQYASIAARLGSVTVRDGTAEGALK